ncbi:MAG: hypothetical protein AABW45_02655 [Nanoarchaeota archaeon]
MNYKNYKKLTYFLVFLLVIVSVNASVDTINLKISNDPQNYNYTVVGRTYNLDVFGSNLATLSDPQLTFIPAGSNSEVMHYIFAPGNTAGLRNFIDSNGNSFNIKVLGEADELANSIGSVVIEVNDTSSTIKVNGLDLSNKIIRNFDFNLNEYKGRVDLSNLLGGITFDLGFVKDGTHPRYNQLNINAGSSAGTVMLGVLNFNNILCNGAICTIDYVNANKEEILNKVIDKYGANVKYIANGRAIKQGNDFSFYTDEGYTSLNGTHLQNLQDLINNKVKFIDPDEVVNALIPFGNFSNFTQFVDFKTTVDFGDLRLEDGTYTLKIKYEDRFGNKGEKLFTVKLDVTNTGNSDTADNSGVVTFSDPVIKQTLQRIENLPNGLNITAVIFGNVKPGNFASPPGEVKTILKFMDIDADQNVVGSFNLFFKIDKSLISSSDKNNVLLYVEESGVWNSLSTSLINETATTYEYRAVLPHFSNYMLGIRQVSTPSTSSGTGGGSSTSDNENIANPIILPPTQQTQPEVTEPSTPTAPTPIIQEAPQGFLAATTAAILDIVNQNPLAAIFFGLVAVLMMLVVYVLLFHKKKPRAN